MTFPARLSELIARANFSSNPESHYENTRFLEEWLGGHAEAIRDLVAAMESIAKNSCCYKCQEAALVAKCALAKLEEA